MVKSEQQFLKIDIVELRSDCLLDIPILRKWYGNVPNCLIILLPENAMQFPTVKVVASVVSEWALFFWILVFLLEIELTFTFQNPIFLPACSPRILSHRFSLFGLGLYGSHHSALTLSPFWSLYQNELYFK